ncbi:MAG: complex I NDUFA9 subunit family protein [Ferrovibrio sp.]|uniref:complex I NDUFA9 subunit family protein n=1 Tax=Ferrovibrio sp. TaxID=1917215 RepID=UPI002606306E|nr:complex I NDUFA9 subunit family protein [Ferrovibrio sp.]MCW0234355.1 complex I NDUFA9 subunit family protein [Ferrovibrio sp.]
MSLRNQLVTVFGGSGFIGRYVVQKLAQQGARVRVAIRRPDEGLFLKPMGAVGQIDIVQANIRMPMSVQQAVQGADAVINCVGILYERGAQKFPAVQARGAEVIALCAREAGVKKMVHVSAIGADADSGSDYAKSKAAGEAGVRRQMPQAAIIRPSVVFGPEDDFFNRFAAMAAMTPALPLVDGGETKLQPVYVGDVATAIVAALMDDAAAGQIYELGGPKVYSMKEIMQLTLAAIHKKRLLLPVPGALLKPLAFALELQPLFAPPITRDQIELLKADNVVSEGAKGLKDLGIEQPTPVEGLIETYLYRYRRGGGKFEPRFS